MRRVRVLTSCQEPLGSAFGWEFKLKRDDRVTAGPASLYIYVFEDVENWILTGIAFGCSWDTGNAAAGGLAEQTRLCSFAALVVLQPPSEHPTIVPVDDYMYIEDRPTAGEFAGSSQGISEHRHAHCNALAVDRPFI